MILTHNKTPYTAETYPVQDINGNPSVVTVIKATFDFTAQGVVAVSDKQAPLWLGDEYQGDPKTTRLTYASDLVPEKAGTDIVLNGHAYAPKNQPVKRLKATLSVGAISKTVSVTGNRYWQFSMGLISMTKPRVFTKMPLGYERAFGGEDFFHDNENKWKACMENPAGTGFRVRRKKEAIDGLKLPNIENPRQLMTHWKDKPKPWAFGFIGPFWSPRAQLCGTYDQTWENQRRPLLPLDFDPAFYNAASPDLIARPFLRGNESVHLSHVHPKAETVSFDLPGIQPMCSHIFEHQTYRKKTVFDTLVIEPDENRFMMVFRCMYSGKEKLSHMKQVNVYDNP